MYNKILPTFVTKPDNKRIMMFTRTMLV